MIPECQCLECLGGRARLQKVLAWAAMWDLLRFRGYSGSDTKK